MSELKEYVEYYDNGQIKFYFWSKLLLPLVAIYNLFKKEKNKC